MYSQLAQLFPVLLAVLFDFNYKFYQHNANIPLFCTYIPKCHLISLKTSLKTLSSNEAYSNIVSYICTLLLVFQRGSIVIVIFFIVPYFPLYAHIFQILRMFLMPLNPLLWPCHLHTGSVDPPARSITQWPHGGGCSAGAWAGGCEC